MTLTLRRLIAACIVASAVLLVCRPAAAFSVLAHEAMVDALWADSIAPLMRDRFPRATTEQITAARAYAYGGSVIQDLGYFPFGSKLFSNLLHYVRSGDFVETLVREARDPNEYAFALGALAHYASDNVGHPRGVNRVVPIVYPKLRAQFGSEVLYAHSPARHIMVEFAFDVLQVGRGTYTPQAYRDFIGFEVAKPLLARAFQATYALELDDLFLDTDLAIGSYRRAVSTTIPEVTRLAWEDKQDKDGVFTFTEPEYRKAFGTTYKKPGLLSRMLFALVKILPKVGPFRPLAFEPLTPETARLMDASFAAARDHYATLLQSMRAVANTDLDTGKPPARGHNPLAEETYADLVDKLAKNRFAGVSDALRSALTRHYAAPITGQVLGRKERKQEEKARRQLDAMARPGR